MGGHRLTASPESRFWNYRNRERLRWFLWTLAILTPCVLYTTLYRSSRKSVEITVDRRERVTSGSGDSVQSYYLVWTREGEVFTVTDTLAFLRWDASDRYGRLKEGKRFRVEVAGWRVGFLSWYRNVISLEEIAPPDAAPGSNP
jgi:hypothetical protein